ncbi:bifunctional YncE family protein/alkaline phosphatase family protein [Sediminibacterium sp.]|uniref:bifunctional YncE family protein/alkaline phosphatase family protein n=1 Tax=Sediminibacterium sp. TaxID=1917865 RepID=UPI0027324D6F|nr:bifunctional YncE family protein/alkaline phosphatase family protein [Sediminibacterium sp.]MDP3393408.1 bifunctional YncE family protein/alkaline phosphatase family protein [Sediminibacterium sp.]MDP3568010.1 bifunctional YncE family protein/alkaline phosphatase family protein [Sediminibacterium sp.]
MYRKLIAAILLLVSAYANAQTVQQLLAKKVLLPNGWALTPIGKSFPLGDLPLNMVLSKSKQLMAVTNNGQGTQSIQLINPITEKILDTKIIERSWYGLVFSADEKKLYASGGHNNRIEIFSIDNNKLTLTDSIVLGKKWPNKISPAGIAIDDEQQLLYVVTREDNQLYIIDIKSKKTIFKQALGGEAYACVLSPNKKQLYISCWGCDKVYLFNTIERKISVEIPVGDNPNELLLNNKGTVLYVANANDNSVSVINTKEEKVVEVLNVALYPDAPNGSTTNGLALSADEKTLFVANADNNCLAVYDVSKPIQSKSKGFIPVGWYPTNVKVVGNKIFVSNGKGFSSKANVYGPNPFANKQIVMHHEGDPNKPKGVEYIGGLFMGTMSIINMPTPKQMSVYSQVVYQNTPYNKVKEKIVQGEAGNPIPRRVGDKSPIKYVFYVIKENRTYDQVLGDMKEGNGDPRLTLFGENITPNQHALARNFVLLDNFYVDGEVSMDGHNWTMGAYATDFLEKSWVSSYGGRGGSYDGEGNRKVANNKGGFFWDHAKKAGVSFRSYGEFVDNYKANIPVLEGNFCKYFTGYNNSVMDTTRFYQWKRDFDSLLAINKVPQFNSVRFSNDHTEGLKLGRPTPYAHVADNDYAVGLFVEYLSKSPIWKETAIFIVEDDAQNGADHVDAHRSIAFVAGGFVKRGYIDHTMYSTSSALRTMELILGIPPMSQYDAAATPMWRCFTSTPNTSPFTALMPNMNLKDKNTAKNEWQRRSELFNLAKEDAVPDLEFNKVLWHGLKGDHIPFPGPKRAAFYKPIEKADKD